MSCSYYYWLYSRLEAAGQAARVREIQPAAYPPYAEFLQRMRAHREDCPECNADFDRAFPEAAGKMVTVSLIEEKEIA